MIKINKNITSYESARDFVLRCETGFEAQLVSASESICAEVGLRMVTLAGPTCSGKTTTAAKLTDDLDRCGKRARVLSIDDFYRDSIRVPTGEKPDYESAAAIDLDYFAEAVTGLVAGKRVLLPTFDFKTGRRTAECEYIPHKNDIYIFEGIQAVYPEITSLLSGYDYKSVFISVAEGLSLNGTEFSKNELRLMRRIVRDYNFRASSLEYTMYLWDDVRKNEDINIYPYVGREDITINSLLYYEPYMISAFLLPIITACEEESVHSGVIAEMREKLCEVSNPFFKSEFVPLNSVFREFIG